MRASAGSPRQPRAWRLWPALVVLFLTTATIARAAPTAVVVLYDGLALEDLRSPALPHLAALARTSSVGLMNTAVAGPKTDTAAVLTLALGYLAPAEETDMAGYTSDEPAVEGSTAGVVFARRVGVSAGAAGAPTVLHLGVASLLRRGLSNKLVGAAAAAGGRPGAIVAARANGGSPSSRGAALFAIGAGGIGPYGPFSGAQASLDALARWALAQPDIAVVHLGGLPADALDRFIDLVWYAGGTRPSHLLVVSPRPAAGPGGRWDRLAPAVLAGGSDAPGLVGSGTTRTPGILANIDVAPTLLGWLGVRQPVSMTGHPLQSRPARDALAALGPTDRLITANDHAIVPVFVLLGVIVAMIGFGGLACLQTRPDTVRRLAFPLLCLINMPVGLLLAVPLLRAEAAASVPAPSAYAATVLAVMVACAVAETMVAGRVGGGQDGAGPLMAACGLTMVVLVLDAVTGQTLVKYSLLSSYQLQGIRFYGIGNEYMGMLIGFTLVGVFVAGMPRRWAAAVFLVIAGVIGYPRLGANAGGLVAAVAAFGVAVPALRGARVGWRAAAGWALAGLAAAFGLALVDRALPGGAPSHIGGSLQAAGGRGYGYLLDIVVRKVAMNARILASPGTLSALLGVVLATALARGPLQPRLSALMAAYPRWRAALPAAAYGALAAFLFNDSGAVAGVFLFGVWFIAGVYFSFTRPDLALPVQETR